MKYPIKYRVNTWYQVDGDHCSPETYGATYAREDAHGNVEVYQIQPVQEYVGDEAREVGFPFWTREGFYTRSELEDVVRRKNDGCSPLEGYEEDRDYDLTLRGVRLGVAAHALSYGEGADEGPCGWSEDVLGYFGKSRCVSRKDFRAADREFKRFLKEK
jgi:hypothetical protein